MLSSMYTRMLVEVLSQNLTNGSTNISVYILPIISTISSTLLICSYTSGYNLLHDIVDTLILTVVRMSGISISSNLNLISNEITRHSIGLQQSIRILLGHECNCDQMSLSSRYISSIRSHLQTYS